MRNEQRQRRIPTITFQPDDDILEIINAIVAKNSEKGFKTKVLNASLRAGIPLAAEADAAAAKARLEVIKNGLRDFSLVNSVADDRIVDEHLSDSKSGRETLGRAAKKR